MEPTFIDGIGPPLEQVYDDHKFQSSLASRDILRLIEEVWRLRELAQDDQFNVMSYKNWRGRGPEMDTQTPETDQKPSGRGEI